MSMPVSAMFIYNPRRKLDRQHQAYEHFKGVWMLNHGYTLLDLFEKVEELMANYCEDLDEAIENFENNVGFDGDIWPCFREFMDCEYYECGYAESWETRG